MNEIVVFLARWALGSYLLWNAVNHYKSLEALTGYASYKGLRYARELVIVSGVLLAVTGLSVYGLLVPGWVGAITAALFFVPVSVKMHDYWNIHVPTPTPNNVAERSELAQARQMDQVQFTKNLAILAGLLLVLLA